MEEKYQTLAPRFWALMLDTLLLLPLGFISAGLEGSDLSPIILRGVEVGINLISVLYFIIAIGFYGQTIGKRLMKIKVLDAAEKPLLFSQAIMREMPQISYILILLILGKPTLFDENGGANTFALNPGANFFYIILSLWGIADIIVFFMNDKRRALHDYIAGTVVVKLNAPPI